MSIVKNIVLKSIVYICSKPTQDLFKRGVLQYYLLQAVMPRKAWKSRGVGVGGGTSNTFISSAKKVGLVYHKREITGAKGGVWNPNTPPPPTCRPVYVCWIMKSDILTANVVIRHLLRRQLLLPWYLAQQRVGVRVMIGFLVQGRVRIKIRIRVRVRVRVMFNISVYHWSNCRRSKCHTFHFQYINEQEAA